MTEASSTESICVIGLGYVGLTLSVALAEAGYRVHGTEINEENLAKVQTGRAFFHEPGLNDRLSQVVRDGRMVASNCLPDCGAISVYIITVGTPLGPDGRTRLDMVEDVARQLSSRIKDGDAVCLRSTVKLGTTRALAEGILKHTGRHIDVAFCPERTLEGKALEELAELPQIVGGLTSRATERFLRIFMKITPTVIAVRDSETAEMIKLVDNTSRDVSFAFANEISRLCGQAGLNAAEVIRFGKLGYPRTNLPMPGPVGGPCLSKDPYILLESFENSGIEPRIVGACRAVNEAVIFDAVGYLSGLFAGAEPDLKISILGLAFKGRPETDDLRGSTAVPLIGRLREAFPHCGLFAYDPVVAPEDARALGVQPVGSLAEAFEGSKIVIIHNNHPSFSQLRIDELSARMSVRGCIYDYWNLYSSARLQTSNQVSYMAYGSHPIVFQ